MLKRYLVFAGDTYYPGGGWADFKGSFESLKEGMDAAFKARADWAHVVDSTTGERVSSFGEDYTPIA